MSTVRLLASVTNTCKILTCFIFQLERLIQKIFKTFNNRNFFIANVTPELLLAYTYYVELRFVNLFYTNMIMMMI